MVGIVDLTKTKLAITGKLSLEASQHRVINKINEIIDKINFLDEHINFLYDRSRNQHNTIVGQASGLQNVYDEFQEFKKRFATFEASNEKIVDIIHLESKRTKLDLLGHQDNN